MFEDLKDIDDVGKGTVNVLDSTQQLESFAFKYAKIHFKKKQSFIIMEENYGMSIYSVTISTRGSGKLLSFTTLEAGHMTDNRYGSYKTSLVKGDNTGGTIPQSGN